MWNHQVFEERILGTPEAVRTAVCAFLSERNFFPSDIQITETQRHFNGATGLVENLTITVYWQENALPLRRRL